MSNTYKIVTLGAARAAGLKRYFTGQPCRHGHVDERLVSNSLCIVCHRAHWRASKAREPKKFIDARNAWGRRRYHADLAASRTRAAVANWKRAGITPAWPRPEQCECCGGAPSGRGGLHADHDHATGKFRGWLCSRCNMGIGQLGDTLANVLRAARYLRRAK